MFRHYCIQNVEDGTHIWVYKINNESVIHFRQYILVKVKKNSRKSQAQFAKLNVFIGQNSMFRHYCIQNVEDGTHIWVYKINNESVIHFRQFISVKVKKILRKSQAQFRKKLRKLKLRKNDGFL